eukprot:1600828-Rhodomonas_salina.1
MPDLQGTRCRHLSAALPALASLLASPPQAPAPVASQIAFPAQPCCFRQSSKSVPGCVGCAPAETRTSKYGLREERRGGCTVWGGCHGLGGVFPCSKFHMLC